MRSRSPSRPVPVFDHPHPENSSLTPAGTSCAATRACRPVPRHRVPLRKAQCPCHLKKTPVPPEVPSFFNSVNKRRCCTTDPRLPPAPGLYGPTAPGLQPAQLPREPLRRAGQLPEARAIQSLSGIVQTAPPRDGPVLFTSARSIPQQRPRNPPVSSHQGKLILYLPVLFWPDRLPRLEKG